MCKNNYSKSRLTSPARFESVGSSKIQKTNNPKGLIRDVLTIVLIREGVSPGHPYEFVGVPWGDPYELFVLRCWVVFFLRSPSCLFLCLEITFFCVSTSPSFCFFSFEFTLFCVLASPRFCFFAFAFECFFVC